MEIKHRLVTGSEDKKDPGKGKQLNTTRRREGRNRVGMVIQGQVK